MASPIDKYLQNDLADFAGLRVTGTVPVKQEILNDLLQTVLSDMQKPVDPDAPATETVKAASGAGFDPKGLIKHVKKAAIRAEDGRLVLDFDIAVEG